MPTTACRPFDGLQRMIRPQPRCGARAHLLVPIPPATDRSSRAVSRPRLRTISPSLVRLSGPQTPTSALPSRASSIRPASSGGCHAWLPTAPSSARQSKVAFARRLTRLARAGRRDWGSRFSQLRRRQPDWRFGVRPAADQAGVTSASRDWRRRVGRMRLGRHAQHLGSAWHGHSYGGRQR
jgi:hypothetical protein